MCLQNLIESEFQTSFMDTFRFPRVKFIFCVLALLLGMGPDAHALRSVERDGLYFHFSGDEQAIAARLIDAAPAMIEYLAQKGLTISRPLHIILDDALDAPEVDVDLIPHREIQIPLRAPGVLEDGFTEPDPWSYFLFKGLCLQAIYGTRSGVPGLVYYLFGEIISPNLVLPPWVEHGIAHLLYTQFKERPVLDPLESAIFNTTPVPDVDDISHHPQVWPGYYGYRIFGKPFIAWLEKHYGWERILRFIELHGRGVIPIEIDLKIREVFGKTGNELWSSFQTEFQREDGDGISGKLITGYWGDPFTYWNHSGVFPGRLKIRVRGRYGYVDEEQALWISEFLRGGTSNIIRYTATNETVARVRHAWDPGPGPVAVTRKGRHPQLLLDFENVRQDVDAPVTNLEEPLRLIPGPAGAIQLSGPVMDALGRIAVAAHMNGNWDIWVWDRQWRRVTSAPSIEMDPWWEHGALIFTSNVSGRFQIHQADMRPVSDCPNAATFPRNGKYLCLTPTGWQISEFITQPDVVTPLYEQPRDTNLTTAGDTELDSRSYTPLTSILPNYLRPDLFIDVTDFQFGLNTKSRDVTGKYTLGAGIRYSADDTVWSGRLGLTAGPYGLQFVRYPLSYTTDIAQIVDEIRNEFRLLWAPEWLAEKGIGLYAGWREFGPLNEKGSTDTEGWGGADLTQSFGQLRVWGNLDLFSESRQSLYGGFSYPFGRQIYSVLHLMAGRTWGDALLGHDTFRIGGNVAEGYFTQRPTRLFPLRGFDSNALEASTAFSGGLETFWPLANLQMGYKTLPLFLHRLKIGTFADMGAARDSIRADDLLVGAGVELILSMEVAWDNRSELRVGVAWPVVQPDYLDATGPVFMFQIGSPL
jgi:hypothetical protein